MRKVSQEWRQAMQTSRKFYASGTITFANGIKKEITRDDVRVSGNYVSDSAESSSFPIGILVAKQVTLVLENYDERWSEYDFLYAKISLKTCFDVEGLAGEFIDIGTYTVVQPESYGDTIEIVAMDDSYKTDKEYSTELGYPLMLRTAVQDSCNTCGIQLGTTTFANDTYIIPEKPSGLTHRAFLGMCAMIAGGNASFNKDGQLIIRTYDLSLFTKLGTLDGGVFDNGNPYVTGDDADGGSFLPWNTGFIWDEGDFKKRDELLHVFFEFKPGMKVSVDDVIITGVQLTDSNGVDYLYGSEGYVIKLQNDLAAGKEVEVLQLIGQILIGLRFRPFSGDHSAYPMAEFMDLAYIVDRKQNVYQTVLTDVNFNYAGYTTLKCSADSHIRNGSKYYDRNSKPAVKPEDTNQTLQISARTFSDEHTIEELIYIIQLQNQKLEEMQQRLETIEERMEV